MTRRFFILALSTVLLLVFSASAPAGMTQTAAPANATPVHLAIFNATNFTKDPGLDWLAPAALEFAVQRLSYMKDMMLLPLPEEAMQNPVYLKMLPELDIKKGLLIWVGNGTDGRPYIGFMIKDLDTGSVREFGRVSGRPEEMIRALPGAIPALARTVGYEPSETEAMRASSPASDSLNAWKFYESALYSDKPVELLKKALREDPGFAEAEARLGLSRLLEKKYEEAAIHLSKALNRKPYLYTALAAMAVLFDEKGDPGESARYIEALKESNIRNVFAYTSWNVEKARQESDLGLSEGYDRLGADAALAALQSPLSFEGAFNFLRDDIRHRERLFETLNSPNELSRLTALAQFRYGSVNVETSEIGRLMNSDKVFVRMSAMDEFLFSDDTAQCSEAIKALGDNARFDLPEMKDENPGPQMLSSLTRAIIFKCEASHSGEVAALLDSENKDIALAAACILGFWGDRSQMDRVVEAYGRNELWLPASKALSSLAEPGDIPRLASLIQNAPSAGDWQVLSILASFDTPEANAIVESGIYASQSPYDAIQALSQSGTEFGENSVLRALKSDSPNVAETAASSLRSLVRTGPAIEGIKEVLRQKNLKLGKSAIEALAAMEAEESRSMLLGILLDPEEADALRARAAYEYKGFTVAEMQSAIANSGPELKVELLNRMAEADPAALYMAFEEQVSIHDTKSMRAGLKLIAEKAIASPPDNARALGEIALRAMAKEDGQLTSHAINALGSLALPDSSAPLMELLRKSPPAHDRANIIRALGNIRDKKSFDTIKGYLKDPDEKVRLMAMIALVKAGERVYMDDITGLARQSGKYSQYLLLAHKELGDPLLAAPIAAALELPVDKDDIIKALNSLGSIDTVYGWFARNPGYTTFEILRNERLLNGNLSIITGAEGSLARSMGHYMGAMRAMDAKDYKAARKEAEKSARYAGKSKAHMLEAAALTMAAEALMAEGNVKKAAKTLAKAMEPLALTNVLEQRILLKELGGPARVHLLLGKAFAASGKPEEARAEFVKARKLASATPLKRREIMKEAIEALDSL